MSSGGNEEYAKIIKSIRNMLTLNCENLRKKWCLKQETYDSATFCDDLETVVPRQTSYAPEANVAKCCMPGEGRAPTCFRNGRRLAWTGCLRGGRSDDVSRRGRVFWLAAYTIVSRDVKNPSITLISILCSRFYRPVRQIWFPSVWEPSSPSPIDTTTRAPTTIS